MMRRLQKRKPDEMKGSSAEPIVEGIVRTSRGREWNRMSDEELIKHTKDFIKERGIGGRSELEKADLGLYEVLRIRRLLDELGLDKNHRSWAAMNDVELVDLAKRFISEKGIEGRKELEKTDKGLYEVLRTRKLLDLVGLERKLKDWTAMNDGELVDLANSFIAEEGIRGRRGLVKADRRLYEALRRRKLMDAVGLEDTKAENRNWAAMSDEKLVSFAKEFIAEGGVDKRGELRNTDRRLYDILWRRGLLSEVFSDVESSKHAEVVRGVLDALETFGDDP